MSGNNFVKADSKKSLGTSKIAGRYEINSMASDLVGDFLSKLWANFGPPDSVQYEGFDYTLKHVPTGIVFTAYSAGSGPAYGSRSEDKERLAPVLKEFEELLESTLPANCEIEYDTDYGRIKSGSKDGKPFDIEANE